MLRLSSDWPRRTMSGVHQPDPHHRRTIACGGDEGATAQEQLEYGIVTMAVPVRAQGA
jgi:hypothetical protein